MYLGEVFISPGLDTQLKRWDRSNVHKDCPYPRLLDRKMDQVVASAAVNSKVVFSRYYTIVVVGDTAKQILDIASVNA